MEASTITSFGEWKLVMPLAESTVGQTRTVFLAGVQIAVDLVALGFRQGLDLLVQVDRTIMTLMPSSAKVLACLSKASLS